nr:MAG TPA: hypothetical protein [Caudoviricetes sp.]
MLLQLTCTRARILKIKTDRIMEQYSEHSRTISIPSQERLSEISSQISRTNMARIG